ncbi:MAG TPA: aminotransferase class IV [Candidatus Thermoplasmatota archaeon]|nr:aminotransferase class IV [Candidatus Thermoplasmatota archaeon]
MPPAGIAYLDGQTLDLATARVPLNDRGFLLGDGVFETLRTSNGRVFRLEGHAERMASGLRAVNLDAALVEEFRQAVAALVRGGVAAFGGELYVRVMVTTGPMEDFLETGRGVMVTGLAKKFKPYPMQYYSQGVHLVTSRERKDSRSALASVKTLSFLPYVTARREAHSATAHDALLLNEQGRVAEATTSNVFALRDGTVHAPGAAEGAIPGVTRSAVLELVRDAGFPVVERLETSTLRAAEEVWLTNTTGGIVPVRQVDEHRIGEGRGELAARLGHALEAAIRGDA